MVLLYYTCIDTSIKLIAWLQGSLSSFFACVNLSSADNLCKQFRPKSGHSVSSDLDSNHLTLKSCYGRRGVSMHITPFGEKNFPFEYFVGHKHGRMFSCQ